MKELFFFNFGLWKKRLRADTGKTKTKNSEKFTKKKRGVEITAKKTVEKCSSRRVKKKHTRNTQENKRAENTQGATGLRSKNFTDLDYLRKKLTRRRQV